MSAPVALEATTVTSTPPVRAVRRSRHDRGMLASVALHATLVVASFVALFPVAWVLLASFKPNAYIQRSGIALVSHPTLDNYRFVLFETNFPRWFLNSVVVAVVTMLLGITMSAMSGYAMARFRFPGKRALMWTFLITQMFPVAILIVPIYTLMSRLGLINTHISLVIAYCTVAVPFCAWMMKGYFETIPVELDEAARVDGLGAFGVFFRVALPLARPGLAVTAFYTFLTAWGEVAYASAFLQSDRKFTLAYGLQQFVPRYNPHWDYLTAAAVLVTIPAAVMFFFAQRHLVAGLTAGGTKG